jgi:hypothetical protein
MIIKGIEYWLIFLPHVIVAQEFILKMATDLRIP